MDEIKNRKTELDAYVEKVLFDSFLKVFRVNINTGAYEVFLNNSFLNDPMLDEAPDIFAYLQRIIDEGLIYPEYITACRRFTNPEYVRKSVFSGDKRIVQSYRRRTGEGDKWITFAIIVGNDCSPENPMVLFTWRESDSDTITLLDTLPTISSLYDKLIRINLSNNTFEPVLVDADDQEQLVGGVINMYEWWASYSKDGNIAAEDMGEFSALTKSGSLQKRFAEDPTPVNFRYRRKMGDEFRWVQLQIAPSVEYSEENQIMLLSLKDIHEEYTAQLRSRQELVDNMNTDALTGLYNRLKFNADMDAHTKSSEPLFTCLYIDINGLHELNNLLGHQKGDEMLCCVADTLKQYFPDEKVYRIGGDEFVVLSVSLSKEEIEVIVDKVRADLLKYNYEVSVGAMSGACGENVEKIVGAAESKMRDDKAAYYRRKGDRRRKREMNEELEQMLVEKRDNERFLDIITNQFAGVFFVELTTDIARPICKPKLFGTLVAETNGAFAAAMRLYVERYVKSEYHDSFEDILDYDKLDQRLRRNENVELTFEKVNGDNMVIRVLEVYRQKNAMPETIWMIWKKYVFQ